MLMLLLYSLIFYFPQVKTQAVDYYWSTYNGDIPEDALPGGKDVNGVDTYIGHVFIENYGTFIGEIFPGQKHMDVQCYGVERVEKHIEILCAEHKERFRWLETKSTTFKENTLNLDLVQGGYNYKHPKILNIDRTNWNHTVRIGAVAPDKTGQAFFYFANGGKREETNVFEVLFYYNEYRNDVEIQ